MKQIILLLALIFLSTPVFSQFSTIIPNEGQWREEIKFVAKSKNNTIWGTDKGLVYRIFEDSKDSVGTFVTCDYVDVNTFDMRFTETDAYHNYMLGNDTTKWRKHVPLCTSAEAKNVFHNVDIKYFFQDDNLRYDFYLHNNAKPESVKLRFKGHEGLSVDKTGNLVIHTKAGDITHGNLKSYKSDEILAANKIESSFQILDKNTVSFEVLNSTSEKIVIDPVIFGSYYGSYSDDEPFDSELLDNGKVIIVGRTGSDSLPLSPNAIDTSYEHFGHGYIAVFDSKSNKFLYATLWGAGEGSSVRDICVDKDNNVYVLSNSQNDIYYRTDYAFQQTELGTQMTNSCFTIFDPEIQSIYYSTPFASLNEHINLNKMEVKDDLVYFTGAQVRLTENYKIKPTDGAYQPNYTVSEQFPANIFIAAFDYNKSDFRYLTYIGTVKTRFYSFKLDQEKNVYIIGQYEDDDILMTEGAYSQISGNEGIYLGKLDSTLSHAKYFVGISEQDNAMGNFNGYDIAPFSNGDVAVVSQVLDPQFPIEEYNFYYKNDDPFYDVLGGGTSITKLNQNATEVIAAAHIEYFVTPLLNKIIAKVDNHDNLYIYSHATEDSLPTTPNHLGNKFLGDAATPGYLTVFDSNLDSLKYGTYICGNKDLYIKEIDIDSSGNVALLSYTWSYEYMPVTGGFFESFGDMDAHILVLKPDFVTGVEAEVIFDSSVKTYPNPISNGKLNIVLEDNEEVIGMQVYSYLGELVFNSEFADNTFTKEIELNVDNYTKGAYVIRIQCKDKVISKNIIVE